MIDPSDEKRFLLEAETSPMKRRLSTVESTLDPQLTRYSSAGEKERDTEMENEEDRRKTMRKNPILEYRIAIAAGRLHICSLI